MKLFISKYIGSCFGVRNAINEVFSHNGKVKIFGEIAHNEKILNKISKMKNVKIIHNVSEIGFGESVITRAHGIALGDFLILKKNNVSIIDKTCPHVKFIHTIAEKCSLHNDPLIIVGDENHPEVIGIKSRCVNSVVIDSICKIKNIIFDKDSKITTVSQTTFNLDVYNEICSHLKKKFKNLKVYNTICYDSINRRKELVENAIDMDMIIVVGSKMSSNSVKLFNLAKNLNNNSVLIQDYTQIDKKLIEKNERIFITSGASVMIETINEIINSMKLTKID